MSGLQDALWGEIELSHPALNELERSSPVQRLRGINMAGASCYLYPDRRTGTRYEHSLGVAYILGRLGASLAEQVAGLLHDIPHTAFSHTIDTVHPSKEYNYHEHFQHTIVARSVIPDILACHGISLAAALEPAAFPLLEQPLPGLCADRIDYALRDMQSAGMLSKDEAATFVDHLIPSRQGILVDDVQAALWFASHYLRANNTLWTAPDEAGAYWALAGAIKRAYATGGLSEEDLFSDDEKAMNKLRSQDDDIVQAYLALLVPGTNFYEVHGQGPSFHTIMKQRVVDPLVKLPAHDRPQPLSQLSPEYGRQISSVDTGESRHYRLWSDRISPRLRDRPDCDL